jgi:hypothetical protein
VAIGDIVVAIVVPALVFERLREQHPGSRRRQELDISEGPYEFLRRAVFHCGGICLSVTFR